MRDAETVLSIIRERGRRRLPLDGVYRLLFNPTLYLIAYGKVSRNAGAMTPGVTDETADGMSQEKIGQIIGLIREERYRFEPARRVYIEKKNSTKKRPLSIPTWSDKLVQEAVRLILEAYYEPRFSEHSHGFRPERGCHTALKEIHRTWTGTAWFIEGDIKGCFDNLDHEVMMGILREDIQDNRFLRLIEGMLKAGYLEEWIYHRTLSGSPQGGVVSPILANIYLDRLDQYVEQTLIPEYTRGTERKRNRAYKRAESRRYKAVRRGDRKAALEQHKLMMSLPTVDPNDADYRRLRYIRYADDFLLGYTGTREEAEGIKQLVKGFLGDTLNLELSDEKTLITHGRAAAARFLGYEIVVRNNGQRRTKRTDGTVVRTATAGIGLKVPLDVVREKSQPYLQGGKPIHRAERTVNDAYSIVAQYEAEYRGVVEYYRLAYNLHRFRALKWHMESSLTKTLAHKLRISVPEVYRRYQRVIQEPRGQRKVLMVTVNREGKTSLVATWGGRGLARDTNVTLDDNPSRVYAQRTEIVQRLLADTCELCGSQEMVQVHHIRALKDLNRPGRPDKPAWATEMAARRRKTLVVCQECHVAIHAGRPTRSPKTSPETGEPDAAKVARPVRRGADGKGAA